jgi:hypothetical protein
MWRSRPNYRPAQKQAGLNKLIAGKKLQAGARSIKDQFRNTVASIEASIKRNKQVFLVKNASKLAGGQEKAAAKVLTLVSKIATKANVQKAKLTQKVWTQRHSLLQQWRVLAGREKFKRTQAAGASGTQDGDSSDTWVDLWAAGGGKAHLTPEGLASLIQAIPKGHEEAYQQMIEKSHTIFASESGTNETMENLKVQRAMAMKEHQDFKKEQAYFARQQNTPLPTAQVKYAVSPGIVQTASPGTVGTYSHVGTQRYHQRYVYIQGQLQLAASRPPPPDYRWERSSALTQAPAQGPMITYPAITREATVLVRPNYTTHHVRFTTLDSSYPTHHVRRIKSDSSLPPHPHHLGRHRP